MLNEDSQCRFTVHGLQITIHELTNTAFTNTASINTHTFTQNKET